MGVLDFMFRLKSVEISQWATIKQATVDFPRSGLVLITGRNVAVGSHFESIGSGKTSLGEAICRTIYGYPGRFTQLSHYAPSANARIHVKVNGILNDEPVSVEMGHKFKELSPTGEGFQYKIGTQDPIRYPNVAETQRQFRQLIGINPDTVRWTVFVDGQNRVSDLNQAQLVELLMSTLNLPSWQTIHGKAKEMHRKLQFDHQRIVDELERLTQDIEQVGQKIEEAELNLLSFKEDYEADVVECDRLKAECDIKIAEAEAALEAGAAKVRARLVIVAREQAANDLARNEAIGRVNGLKAKLALANKLVATRSSDVREAKSKRDLAQSVLLKSQASQQCPTCNQPIKVDPSQLERYQEDLVAKIERVNSAEVALTEAWGNVKVLDNALSEATVESQAIPVFKDAELDQLNEALPGLQTKWSNARMAKLQIKDPSRNKIELWEGLLTERQTSLTKLQGRSTELKAELNQALEALGVGQYWMTAFSPAGIPNQVLSQATEILNLTSRSLAHRLTGGTLSVAYSTTRTLASGDLKCELQVTVSNSTGSSRVQGSSKGESGLVNLVMVETLASIGHVGPRAGFRFYDECINGQDAMVRRSILEHLKAMAHAEDILVFIVDHHPDSGSVADYILTAVKDKDGTTYEWS